MDLPGVHPAGCAPCYERSVPVDAPPELPRRHRRTRWVRDSGGWAMDGTARRAGVRGVAAAARQGRRPGVESQPLGPPTSPLPPTSHLPPTTSHLPAYTAHDPMTRRSVLHAVAVLALLFTSGTLPSAQARNTPLDNAANLIKVGQYDEVEPLLRDEKDPRAIALRARAHIARGRYQDAEKLLTPAAAAAPTSDAALELGLLRMYLGRKDEATRDLQRIIATSQPRTTADYLRLSKAARALGAVRDANDRYFREADR